MPEGLVAFIAVAFIALISVMVIFMKHAADKALKKSDEIMEQFNTIDKELKKADTRLDSLNKTVFD